MSADKRTEYYRKLYRFGFHPTATRAMMLLRISTHIYSRSAPTANGYRLCPFSAETDILSFCIDITQVLFANIADINNASHGTTCLVVDDSDEYKCVPPHKGRGNRRMKRPPRWSQTSPPHHFIFGSISYQRALKWFSTWTVNSAMEQEGISIDMHDTKSDDKGVGTFGCSFASQHSHVVELTLPSTVSATCLSDNFLQDCSCLSYLDVSPLKNVTKIGNYFLSNCSALTAVDLRPLVNVTEIGRNFLCCCSSLTAVDLTPFASLTKIGDGFLAECSALTSVDLSPVSAIGAHFLYGCLTLQSVDLKPLTGITQIEGGFLIDCLALTSVDLTPLANVTSIGRNFLHGCSALMVVDLSPIAEVTEIGRDFLLNCSGLTSVDLSPLVNVTEIGRYFLHGCSTMTSVDL
eukprot:PhM_4_TR3022/c2_g2_i2/m.46590